MTLRFDTVGRIRILECWNQDTILLAIRRSERRLRGFWSEIGNLSGPDVERMRAAVDHERNENAALLGS